MKDPKVIKVLIEEIIYDPDNANKMGEEEFAQLVANIEHFGPNLQPVLVQDTPEGYLMIAGEHRAKASEKAGLKHVLAVTWDGPPEARKALALSLNKIHGEADLTAVQRIMGELEAADWSIDEMMRTGYDAADIKDLLAVAGDISPDDIMQNPIEPVDEDTPANPRPLVLELTFATSEELKLARKGLKKAAGKGRELGQGLLSILGHGTQ